ncbi:hypothetical protein PAXRUDRAFT_393606 [Paxillus rubicundulus Ve08.2h10]|uniref:Uncharacterized protein n=1 Tax=Paxillus rubicundulus Ve08.2h10 TaxID=930991 RepID=A0A0D0DR36_9AGAM|nr:hypothetical protein PAXRUDRAFT_393606 [Paxillus rubicundulus Ve08.2h10]
MPDPLPSTLSGPSRSNSLASTISSSGASLTRRSRTVTRKRTRTIIGACRDKQKAEDADLVLDISAANSAEPFSSPVASPSEIRDNNPVETHPGAGPDAHSRSDIHSSGHADRSSATFGTFAPLIKDEHEATPGAHQPVLPSDSQPGTAPPHEPMASTPALKGKGRNLPRLTAPPSSFKPAPTDADQARSSMRDSLLTQQSSTSSSVYPMSTSTGTESPPSPLSPVTQERGMPIPAFDLDVPRVQEFDTDDVSSRLQLLVKNSYFLPPAHSKPSPADFPPSTLNSSKRVPTPAFLDLFRVGKPKSKPSSPEGVNSATPMLRVTSDSTIVSGHVAHARASPQSFRPPPGSQHMARVAVVREKMDDLAAAAKQAEMDLKAHDFLLDRERRSRRPKLAVFDGIVDPTEAVDVPPPSANYPLALQASALHALGIEDSVGAAVLAEHLPPPGSPGQSSLDPREDSWRRALLHEAVGHSLNNSTATSAASPSALSTPTRLPRHMRSSESLHCDQVIQQQRKMLDRKILSYPVIDPSEDYQPPTPAASSALNHTALVAAVADQDLLRLSSYPPLRVETPVPHTPLSPPPRRPFGNPQYSQSQTELSPAKREALAQSPKKPLRKSISTPMLSDSHESKVPPPPSFSVSPAPSSIHPHDHRMSRFTAFSRSTGSEQDDIVMIVDGPPPRPSLALSLPSTDGRRSISEYSQPSPTASAFRDRWSDGYYSANSPGLAVESQNHSRDSSTFRQPPPRLSTMSPPPRPSSSIVGISLSPPPRAGHLPFQPTSSRVFQSASPSRSSSQGTFRSFASIPSQPQPQSRTPAPLTFNISVQSFHSALHSAPPPSSTTEFFDRIQGHPNAMDDLDESDDSSSETDRDMTAVYAPSSHRPSLTRLGNLSTPNIVPGAMEPYYPSGVPQERKKPVGHVPPKALYFSSVKATAESLTYLQLHSREHLVGDESTPPHPATGGEDNVRRWQKGQQAFEESSRRLDGMLIQHMQAERDTMKRIAETAKVTK